MKVVCLGEIMLRLTPPDYKRIVQTDQLNVDYGGAEANVCVSLANYGIDSVFLSKVPDNALGQSAVNALRRFGVNTDNVIREGERLGIYYCENGASQRPSNVIYDRKYAAITTIDTNEFDWEKIFDGTDWFHFTGITPALSDDVAALTHSAVKIAKSKNIKVSCDLNYRKKLWSREKAGEVMRKLMPYVDVCIANEEDAEMMFGIQSGENFEKGEININSFQKVAEQLMKKFDLEIVGSHIRYSYNASQNGWQVALYDGNQFVTSKKYDIQIVDRVGGGDSFASGLIYSLLSDKSLQEAAEFGAAASCLKQSIPGDFNHVSVTEVENLAAGGGSGRVKR